MLKLEPSEYEDAAGYLEATGSYLVLRRVPRLPPMLSSVGGLRRGIFLDVETTGLDPARDEIFQLAMVPFAYDAEGRIHGAGKAFCKLREPSVEIPERVTELTDIHSMDVYGCSIHPAEIVAFAGSPDIVVAHNAAFDRRFVERFCPAFIHLPWACSMSQVPWQQEGFEGTKLPYLLMHMGMFHDVHRADEDCHASLALLSLQLPKSGRTGMSHLLRASAEPTLRFWAVGAPFDLKDTLKARGYRWSDGSNGKPRCWYRDVLESGRAEEMAFLEHQVCFVGVDPTMTAIDAYSRFSDRG